jgi:hypothetical protein
MESLYKAMSEEEVMGARFSLLPEGEYDAVVKISTHRFSQQGNVMADMYLSVFDEAGNSHDVRDFLVFTEKMLWKVKHFCDSAGLEKAYLSEQFNPDMAAQKRVRIKLGIKKGELVPSDKLNGKPFGAVYPDKNVVQDYLKKEKVENERYPNKAYGSDNDNANERYPNKEKTGKYGLNDYAENDIPF